MRVCFFGTYNRDHTVNRIYRGAVEAAGYEVVEIHEPLWERTRDKSDTYFGPLSLARLALRWCAAAVRLTRRWWASGGAPVVVVGFNGQLDVLLLRLITGGYRPRIVFAPLVAVTETLVEDRGVYSPGSVGARLLRAVDRVTCRAADTVVVDTDSHARYFSESFAIPDEKLATFHLGFDLDAFANLHTAAAAETGEKPVHVLYFGQYHPLHGMDVVARAVELLAGRGDLRFTFIGQGVDRAWFEPRVRDTGAEVEFVDWLPYDRLLETIASADIVLGIFGSSAKARNVIPNKVYEAAAAGRAVVTAATPAIVEVFADDDTISLCEADGASLASAVVELVENPEQARRMGRAAARMVHERFSEEAAAIRWCEIVSDGQERLMPPAYTEGVPELGVAVLHYNDPEAAVRCLESLERCPYPRMNVLLVDNASRAENRARLEELMAGRFDARTLRLDRNLGYAGGNNLAMRKLFEDGCDQVLVLNADTVVTPDAPLALVRAQRTAPFAGPVGPRVAKDWPGAPAASLGERFSAWRAWFPRSLSRVRFPRQAPYPVDGVLGCAILVSKRLFERTGGFDEDYFAYYEEVDLCLRARAAGFTPTVEPCAEIAHAGHRGFGGGMTEVAAYLKARNLWRLGARFTAGPARAMFAAGYAVMLVASALGYMFRGRRRVLSALAVGVRDGLRGVVGAPPQRIAAQQGPFDKSGGKPTARDGAAS